MRRERKHHYWCILDSRRKSDFDGKKSKMQIMNAEFEEDTDEMNGKIILLIRISTPRPPKADLRRSFGTMAARHTMQPTFGCWTAMCVCDGYVCRGLRLVDSFDNYHVNRATERKLNALLQCRLFIIAHFDAHRFITNERNETSICNQWERQGPTQ